MRRSIFSVSSLVLSGIFTVAAGCAAPDVTTVQCERVLQTQCGDVTQSQPICLDSVGTQIIDPRDRRERDVLFVIDNSATMAQKQEQLARALANYVQQLEATGDDYHIGVITADIGTLPPPGVTPNPSDTRCGTYRGDDGLLQNRSCRDRTQNVSAEFRAACDAHCPTSIMPTQRFLSKDYGVTNVADPVAAIQCLGLVGDSGCEVQSPLEAMRRALDNHLMENAGFLRDLSSLAIFFITDKDDYSVQISQRSNLSPTAMDCGTTNPDPASSCYNRDYRSTARGLVCDQPLNVVGAKTGCRERTGSFLEPLEKYSRFLTALRPVDQLVVGGLWPPSMLGYEKGMRTPYGSGQLIVESTDSPPSQATQFLNRGRGSSAACVNMDPSLTSDPRGYFGLAQLRLSSFLSRFNPAFALEVDICDPQRYPELLGYIGPLYGSRGIDCLAVKPSLDCSGQPQCLVGYVDDAQPYATPDSYLSTCSTSCCDSWANSALPYGPYDASRRNILDPAIAAACAQEAADCYCAVPSNRGLCPGSGVAGFIRKDHTPVAPNKLLNIRCAGERPPATL